MGPVVVSGASSHTTKTCFPLFPHLFLSNVRSIVLTVGHFCDIGLQHCCSAGGTVLSSFWGLLGWKLPMCFFPGTFQRRKLRKSCHVRRHVHSVFHPTGEKWQECVARADTGTFSRYHWRDCGCLRKPLVSSGFSKRHTLGFNIQAPVVP